MAFDFSIHLDAIDRSILRELQENARVTYSELGRRVAMSAPAVAERVRRLEEAGAIAGYRAVVNLDRLGFPLLAFIRVKYPSGDYRPFLRAIEGRPEILECHHVTGDDCFVTKVAARSMRHLEEIAGHLAQHGGITTSLVFSTLVENRILMPPDE
jgi:Lrp/AsnC family leucine-responsive transcriptional regulator